MHGFLIGASEPAWTAQVDQPLDGTSLLVGIGLGLGIAALVDALINRRLAAKRKRDITLRFVVIQKPDGFVFQGLEYDIAAHGDTYPEAMNEFARSVEGQIAACKQEGGDFRSTPPAPEYYWRLVPESGLGHLRHRPN